MGSPAFCLGLLFVRFPDGTGKVRKKEICPPEQSKMHPLWKLSTQAAI